MIHSLFICMFYWQPPCFERDVCYTSRRHEQTETDFIKQRKDEKNQQRGGKNGASLPSVLFRPGIR
ncbi:hypothetical protein FO478_05540 [Heyndrickxia coagulans DSM 1 = ATCC 7050]|nr:hypothetical protein [Heyndrickxia coagulans DSM 1 = ATCC 7050]